MTRRPLPARPRVPLRRSGAGLACRRGVAALVVAWAVGSLAGAVRAGDAPATAPPPAPAPVPADTTPFALSEPHEDLDGEARRADAAAAALAVGAPGRAADPVAAAHAFMDLAERAGSARLPAPDERAAPTSVRPTDGLWWPARDVAMARLAALPPAGRAAVERRWGERATADLELACATRDRARLRAVAARAPVTRAGATALLLVGELAASDARPAEAAAAYDLWLRLWPDAPASQRAAVAARWVDACVLARDERGVTLVARRAAGLATVPVAGPAGGPTAPLADRIATGIETIRAAVAAEARREPAGPPPPARLGVCFEVALDDPALLPPPPDDAVRAPTAAVAVDGDDLLVVTERVARALDLRTGLPRWTWPDPAPSRREWTAAARYRAWEGAPRGAVLAGDLALVVLGDAPALRASSFRHRGDGVTAAELGRETRASLVALGRADGKPRWVTGLADDPDAVLRAADVGVASAPVVVGDRVYVVLSARRAWVESWLACLDLATGRPRFVTFLSRGESGLTILDGEERALLEPRVRAVPRALPPALAAGEVLVVPGTGYAAGVDARDGHVRWVRTLPRYRYDDELREDQVPAADAFDARVAPVAAYGAWVVGAPDAPAPVALEQGTGRLRWVGSVRPRGDDERADAPPLAPEAQVVAAVGPGADGRALVRLAGYHRALELRDLASGTERGLPTLAAWPRRDGTVARVPTTRDTMVFGPPDPEAARGRPHAEGRRVVAARDGTLRATTWSPAAERPWREDDPRAVVADGSRPLPDGDVVRAGARWVVVGRSRLVVVGDLDAERAALASPGEGGPAAQAARACLAARWAPSGPALAAAAARVRAAPPSAGLDAALRAAAEAWLDAKGGPLDDRSATRALAALDALDALAPPARAALYARVGRAFVARREGPGLVALVERWMPWGAACLVDADPARRVAVRGDLYAAEALLPFAAETPEGAAALDAREARAAAALAAARDDAALRRVVDGHPATVAAFVARARLVGRALDAGDPEAVGAVAADLRTRRTPGVVVATAVAAALRAVEADAAAASGDRGRARAALAEARAVAPAAARAARGGCAAPLDRRLRAEAAFVLDAPDANGAFGDDLALWGRGGAPSKNALLSASALAPEGPGAGPGLAWALVRRGVDLEVFDLARPGPGRAVPTLDGGFAGVRLGDLEAARGERGVRVLGVTSAGPAERAGLRVDDVVVAVGDEPVADVDALTRRLVRAAGRTVVLHVVRDGARAVVAVPVEARSDAERAAFASAHAYARADGRFVVASPTGVRAVDPATATSEPLWTWDGPGIVRDVVAADGTVFAFTSGGPLRDGTVVALDAARGAERWRTALPGAVLGVPRVVGSALVVDARDPDRTWILDRRTGAVRASHLRTDGDADVPSAALAPLAPPPSAVASGAVHLLRDGAAPSATWLVGVDVASGWPTWSRLVDESAQHAMVRPRLLAGGALVALVTSPDEVRVVRPDLTGALAEGATTSVDGSRFDRPVWGMLESDSRIAVWADAIHLARTSRDRRSSVGTIALDRRAARDPASEDPAVWHPARRVASPASRVRDDTGARLAPFATHLEATPDGAWVTVAWLEPGDRPVEACTAWWEPDADDRLVVVPLRSTLLYPQPPVRVGRFALLRTDDGFRVVRLRPAP